MESLDDVEVPNLTALRRTYEGTPLNEADLAADPVTQFTAWFSEALAAGLTEPNAMVVATATPDGRPSARTVLLKGFSAKGFVFYTNYESRKGRELAANPRACLLFPWHPLKRQVLVEGEVTRLSPEETAVYFHSRPYGSRLGAWASPQSTVVSSREELDARYAELAARWPTEEAVPVPDFWGGLLVAPDTFEFWQGQINRLHDRFRYRRSADVWTVERLAP
ncbi:pyridoxamine 5'-phosphate oxidase [Rhizohabitans arisaemae]|uniref:pyridoxamine 5'-phosphate oxidase n=1 Tax=Rhizohabitans arisaemae TaxID=2720610 RepID=UPI0024B1CB1E|nr:pyridoxamine 5'-phosphate oxidase [Rhizohabitans arisaemae]